MYRFVKHSLITLFLFLIPTIIIGLVSTRVYAIEFYAWCVSIWLFLHLFQIGLLAKWINRPKASTIPKGVGIWQDIFSALERQARSRKNRKKKINIILQRFYRAAAAMPNGIIILDEENCIEWMNHSAEQHFHLQSEYMGSILSDVVHITELQEYLINTDYQEPLRCGVSFKDEHGQEQKKELSIICSMFSNNLRLITSQDITKLAELDNIRADFVANVSHELLTPLTVISGFIETMQDNPDLNFIQSQDFLSLMKKESDRMQSLLSDLLILSKLEKSHYQEDKEALNLSALSRQLLKDAEGLSAGKHHFQDMIEDNVWIEGIYQSLYNGLSNIIFNTVRYTQYGGEIEVILIPEGIDKVLFAVKDNGPGIAAEHLSRLTERFYRVDKSRSRQTGGTGLGLAITKHALAEHHTHLQVMSTEGKGSIFSVVFETIQQPVTISQRCDNE